MILGDLGADVIKVEPPGGDIGRIFGMPYRGGMSGFFVNTNRNKRSIVIDLKHPDGAAAFRTLVAHADILLHNFRPQVPERLGIDASTLTGLNERLIYCSVTGFGSEGPLANEPCYDTVIQAMSGMAHVQGRDGTPDVIRTFLVDKIAALTAAYQIQAALFARERTGHGQTIELNLLDTFLAFLHPDVFAPKAFLPDDDVSGVQNLASLFRTWETADGYLTLIVLSDEQFQALARACERPDWIDDDRFASLPARIAFYTDLEAMLEPVLRQRTVEEWLARFMDADVPAARVNTLDDVIREPQVHVNGTFIEYVHERAGSTRAVAPPGRWNGERFPIRRGAPGLGEHTREVLRECGLPEPRIDAYVESGAVQQG